MHIGIAGPIATVSFGKFFDLDISKAPPGLGPSDIVQTVKGLVERGHKVSVYTLSPGLRDPSTLEGRNLKIYFGEYRTRARQRLKDFFSAESNYVKKSILLDGPDIVHAHWTYEFALGALKSKKKTLITVWDWAPKVLWYSPDLYRFGRLCISLYTLWRGQHFTAVSPYIEKQLFRYKRAHYPVVPSMLDDSLFKDRKRFLDKGHARVVSVNNGFGKRKNVKTLLRAFHELRRKLRSCDLLLVGNDFGRGEAAEQWASQENLLDGVWFLGTMTHSEVLDLLEDVDLLIHPSLEEAFGMVLVEAMSKKTPVIGGRQSGAVPWVLNYGKAGILTDVTSHTSIAAEAISILQDEAKWRHYSESGYSYAWENFRLSHVVEEYLLEYNKLRSR
jgi:glycosyltransferase involved in cell wall biosynthesis